MRTVLLAVLLLLSARVYALDAKTAYEQAVALEAKGKNASEILPLLEQAARNDSVEAQLMLGKIYQFGRRGVAKNPALAKKWYDMAAARGSQEAMTQLQMIYIKSGHEHFNRETPKQWSNWEFWLKREKAFSKILPVPQSFMKRRQKWECRRLKPVWGCCTKTEKACRKAMKRR